MGDGMVMASYPSKQSDGDQAIKKPPVSGGLQLIEIVRSRL
ncbi:hypothetical protein EV14_0943 [Prochlorococcus sp. MIT 0703]|nr:hypothetical protein EV12_1816 [Prochlorococcus sp. MIT 0701]KGG34899.1 hypothetical protein EV14_0943 [Prochlorococcus sp. MIT 0703]